MAQPTSSTLLVGIDPEVESLLFTRLKDVAFVSSDPGQAALAEALARHRPTTVVVACPDPEDLFEEAVKLIAQAAQSGARVIALGNTKKAAQILKAVRAGAQDFITPDDDALGAISKAVVKAAPEPESPTAKLTVVFAAKGGAGATTLATHLAGALARRGERVCLLDLCPALGGVLSVLELGQGNTIGQVLANMHRLDRELLDSSLARHASGAWVLGHSDKIEETERVGAMEIAALLAFLRHNYDQLIVDGVRGFSEESLVALDAADRILLMLTQEVPAVRNAQRSIELFRRLGYPDDKIRPVVNRFHKGWKIDTAILAETLGLAPAATLGNDFNSVSAAINRGVLLAESAPRSSFNQDVEKLAASLSARAASPAAPRSLLGRLFSRR
jgi:pilus assembly protein CpaE